MIYLESYQAIFNYRKQTYLHDRIESLSEVSVHAPYQLVAAMHQFVVCHPPISTKKRKKKKPDAALW